MLTRNQYEESIVEEIKTLPDDVLPRLAKLISAVKEELALRDSIDSEQADEKMSHLRTRNLLSGSTTNWAQDVISNREERL